MEKFKLKLSGSPQKVWYRRYTARACLNGREYHCAAGKYNFMIFNVRGCMGLKIMKNCHMKTSDTIKKVREIIRIHKLLFEEGIGAQVDNEVVEIEFDPETLKNYLPDLPMPLRKEDQRWYGFWLETLKSKFHFSLYLYWKFEERFAAKINNMGKWRSGLRRFGIYPSCLVNQLVKLCYRTQFHGFVKTVKIACLRNEIHRNAHLRIGTQTAINEFLNRQNYLYTGKGFKIFDVDNSNGIGPILMNREKLISYIKEGAQFPVKRRPMQYQAIQVKDINLLGGRSSSSARLEEIGFDPNLFQNASLLDIGCNIGAFCFEAQKHGATLTVGIDGNDAAIEAAKCLRNYARNKNMLFFSYHLDQNLLVNIKNISLLYLLKEVADQTHFDVVFALSIVTHVKNKKGFFRQLDQVTKKLLVLEGHADETEDMYRSYLSRYTSFSKVDFKGYSSDRSRRPVLFCWK